VVIVMKILHFINRVGAGGAGRLLNTLIREQVKQGHTVQWCAFGQAEQYCEDRSIPIPVVFPFSFSRRDPIGWMKTRRRIHYFVDDFSPEIVHSHLWPSAMLVESAIGKLGVPHVVHVQDTLPWLWQCDWRSRWSRFRTRRIFRNQGPRTLFLAVSQFTLDTTRESLRFPAGRFRLVPNVVDPVIAAALSDDRYKKMREENRSEKIRVGILGRIEANKGHELFLTALAELIKRRFPIEGRIVGTGSQEEKLRELSQQLGLVIGTDVIFVGHTNDVVSEFSKFDIFTLPSLDSEGMSLSQLEAMAAGLPIVATDVAGAKEAMRNEKEGLIIPPGDVDAFINSLARLINLKELRLSLGDAATERVLAQFSVRQLSRSVKEAYDELRRKLSAMQV
jgi:glycosyltransferase involved in cell wall biosynthesis